MPVDFETLATMNTAILKELFVDDVLHIHPIIDGEKLVYRKAQKTKPIKAKPLSTILNGNGVTSKIVLATLEGHESLKANAFVCWGIDNDIWQQSEKNLHAKYTPTHVDPDGWIHFDPKPDVPVDACQVVDASDCGPAGGFCVINPTWGDERVIENKQVYLQFGVLHDYVLRGTLDPLDTYRVAQRFFNNTYEFLK